MPFHHYTSAQTFSCNLRPLLLLLAAVCLLQVGCGNGSSARMAIPTYQWLNPEQGVYLANQRATSIDTFFAVGDMVLDIDEHVDAQGKNVKASAVKLQVAVVALGDQRLHLRAWRKKQPVMSITLNADGLYVWTAPGSESLPMTNKTVRLLPAILRSSLSGKTTVVSDGSPWLRLRQMFAANGQPAEYLMHKPTLTIRRHEFRNAAGEIIEAINLEDYDLIDMYPWPRRLIASSEAGSMRIDFTDVQLNSRLPDQAFVPPAAAVKQ